MELTNNTAKWYGRSTTPLDRAIRLGFFLLTWLCSGLDTLVVGERGDCGDILGAKRRVVLEDGQDV